MAAAETRLVLRIIEVGVASKCGMSSQRVLAATTAVGRRGGR